MKRIEALKGDVRTLLGVFQGEIGENLAKDNNFSYKRKQARPDGSSLSSSESPAAGLLKSVTRHAMVQGGKAHPFDNITLHDFDPVYAHNIYRRKDIGKSPAVPGMAADQGARRNPNDRHQYGSGLGGDRLTQK